MTKRLFDVVVAALCLIALAPLFVIIAIAIKGASHGPVLFSQERIGRAGKPFRILKFRSMIVDAPTRGSELTLPDDPRVTGIGRLLRTTKLDELPQLINVLMGDMSLVGPRPEVPKFVALYPDGVRERVLSIRPGITDQAAIALDEEGMLADCRDPEWTYVHRVLPRKIEFHEQYVRGHGVFVDIGIILRTVRRIAGSPWRKARRTNDEDAARQRSDD